jgi:hypothetical protein
MSHTEPDARISGEKESMHRMMSGPITHPPLSDVVAVEGRRQNVTMAWLPVGQLRPELLRKVQPSPGRLREV